MRAKRTALNQGGTGESHPRNAQSVSAESTVDNLEQLTVALKTQWKRYRKQLKRCQKEFSEQVVHESRVATRRLLSTVELLAALVGDHRIKKARCALKRHLDAFDDLRDNQVQLLYLGKMRRAFPSARPLHEYLQLRAARLTTGTRRRIQRIKTRRMGQLIARCKAELRRPDQRRAAHQSPARLIRAVKVAFARVRRFQERIDPENSTTIHRLRIAFKKFRYMVESLAAFLPVATEKRRAAMQHYQTMMGEIQDIEVLLATLVRFLKKQELAPESVWRFRDELLRRRRWLIRCFLNSADDLREFEPRPSVIGDSARRRKRGNVS